MTPERKISLIGFMQAQNCSTYPGSWRHVATDPGYLTPEYYQNIARVLEQGMFDMAFFDDRLAMPDIYSGDHAQTVAAGVLPCVRRSTPSPASSASALRSVVREVPNCSASSRSGGNEAPDSNSPMSFCSASLTWK